MADSPKRRLECVWCTPPHPLDGRGPITKEERQAGVSSGMCPTAARKAREGLAELPDLVPAEDLERAQLLHFIEEKPPEPETDEAGVHKDALGVTWRMYMLFAIVFGMAGGIGAALGLVLSDLYVRLFR